MQTTVHSSENMPSNQKFGWLFASIFAGVFAYFQWKHFLGLAIFSLALSILLVLVTIFIPSFLTPLNKAWFTLSLLLGKVVGPVVLSIIFLLVIIPAALIGRLFGRDALLLKKRQVASYWVDKESIDADSFKNQF